MRDRLNLESIHDRDVACYSISCKNKTNIDVVLQVSFFLSETPRQLHVEFHVLTNIFSGFNSERRKTKTVQSKSENYSLCPQREYSHFPTWGFPNSPIYVHLQPVSPNFLHPRRTLSLGLCLWRHLEQTVLVFELPIGGIRSQSQFYLHMLVINHLHQRELVRNSSTQALSLHYRKVFTFISSVDSQYMTTNDSAGQHFICVGTSVTSPFCSECLRK